MASMFKISEYLSTYLVLVALEKVKDWQIKSLYQCKRGIYVFISTDRGVCQISTLAKVLH